MRRKKYKLIFFLMMDILDEDWRLFYCLKNFKQQKKQFYNTLSED